MKRIVYTLLIVALTLSLFACGEKPDTPDVPAAPLIPTETAPAETVAFSEVAVLSSPEETFAHHPAIRLWDNASDIPYYVEGEPIPSITPYLCEGNEKIIILLRGTDENGSYYSNEGEPIATLLNTYGYDVFVCNYRTGDELSAIEDIRRAVSLVTYYGSEFGSSAFKVATLSFGSACELAFAEACDYALSEKKDEIDTIEGKPVAIFMVNPTDFDREATATPISQSVRVGLYFDNSLPEVKEAFDLAYALKGTYRMTNVEIHAFTTEQEYVKGGECAERYAEMFELMSAYIGTIKFK